MPLPDLIEIVPLDKPVRAEITVPGSKSITNRALILAALADGEVTLEGALWSEDTQIMAECLQELGFMVNVERDPNEACNRTITVYGKGGVVPPGGTEQQPMELFVGNAGTAARFLAAFVCLGKGVYRLHGVPRMHERPQVALFQALRELGYRVDSPNEKLPATIFGEGPKKGKCHVSIEESSQFASALLLSAEIGGWQVEIVGENAQESPYVLMTTWLMTQMKQAGNKFSIDPDASSSSYIKAVDWLFAQPVNDFGQFIPSVRVLSEPQNDILQVDAKFRNYFQVANCIRLQHDNAAEETSISRSFDLGDSIMTAIAVTSFANNPVKFTDLGRLRVQETERVVALRDQLKKCGANVDEKGDTLTVYPSKLHGAEIETYNDHRMAMCFAILGLKVPGIKIKNPACVKKTFPNFFQKLAAPPPNGLGAEIRDGRTGRKLGMDELFAH